MTTRVRFLKVDRKFNVVTVEKVFKTAAACTRFLEKEDNGVVEVLAYSNE